MCIRKSRCVLANLRGSTRFDMYILLKTSVRYETYLDFVRVKCFRDALIRFRLGITELKTHKHIYILHVADNNCPFCEAVEENEYHFLFRCEKCETVRTAKFKHIKRH